MSEFKTPQEDFWAGSFGDQYADRNVGPALVASNLALFSRVLSAVAGVRSVIEFGPNIGLNLLALGQLLPQAELYGVEINRKAVERLRQLPRVHAINGSVLDYQPSRAFDFVLCKGLLIHLNPDELPRAYDVLFRSSARYICIAEYYNPVPVSVAYRGHEERLFKRDFAGDLLDRFDTLRLVNYGFAYRRDPLFAQDDISWFLLEKSSVDPA
jgi:spore coat polysaccharide biosynthesis protein SpsF